MLKSCDNEEFCVRNGRLERGGKGGRALKYSLRIVDVDLENP